MKPSCQPVETKLSTSYFIFNSKIALRPISYVAKMLVVKMSMAETLTVKVPGMAGMQDQWGHSL